MSELTFTRDEMMTVAAARSLQNGMTCFVGVGKPSLAANLARRLHAPDLRLIYESGPIGAKPTRIPLSIGAHYTLNESLNLFLAFTFPAIVAGSNGGVDARSLTLGANYAF